MSTHFRTPLRPLAAAACLLLAGAASSAWAATCTWTGAASGNMSDTGNWNCPGGGGNLPGTGDTVIFPAGAATLSVNNDFGGGSPTFHDVSFAPGYALQGGTLNVGHLFTIASPFTTSAPLDGAAIPYGAIQVNGSPATGWAYLGNTTNISSVTVGDGTGQARAVLGSVTNPGLAGQPPVTVAGQGWLSLGSGMTANSLDVQAGGTLVVSEPPPGAAGGSQVGSATVTGATTLAAGATLEYRALTTFDPGVLTAQGGIALNGATLRVVVEDPANPDAVGLQRTLAGYGDSSQLTGTFAGLPEGATFAASNAPDVYYQITYGSNSNAFIQITRVNKPAVPPGGGGGVASVPVLAPAGLALLSAAVAGVGVLRRRRAGKATNT